MKLHRITLSSETLIVTTIAFFLIFANNAFWQRLGIGLGAISAQNWLTYVAVAAILLALLSLILALFTPRIALKPVLTVLLVIAAGASYFMDNYGAIIDRHALQSAFESDARESAEWLSLGMLWPALKIALVPALLLWFGVEIIKRPFAQAAKRRIAMIAVCALLVGGVIALKFQPLASLARNHAELRDLLNPLNVINATRTYLKKAGKTLPTVMQPIAADVKRGPSWMQNPGLRNPGLQSLELQTPDLQTPDLQNPVATSKPTLLVIVVGESARASSFGLLSRIADPNAPDTTPELAQLPITLFAHTNSCGTNTATSVPCMFSNLGRKNYDETQANSQENLLDIYQRAGFAVTWIDNNTGSKNVARRATEISVAHRTDEGLCVSDGCHDEILLSELDQQIAAIKGDSVLVLHMLGSHGPAYFQRYPERFARFTPVCKSVELHQCSETELKNSYNNTILYSDFVLAEMIKRLHNAAFLQTALFFVSDHGESTGEHGFFLHGAPYSIAPKEQTEVPMFFWLSNEFASARGVDSRCLAQKRLAPTSHDAMFPMLLRLMDLRTSAYRADLDPIATCY